ncbi:substrate-binding domain-containing protein [Pseudomonas typographi]|uniref:ABC transporter substrate-binding protein n=1 Tax=Pseudomonas typographi TaxID=2715964 RepID=A0ABR7Z177_9PSED|nr:substrate-binding domain-containing protein [Pseudomonas typographi]MBD1599233.1 ABC transporter substrate-binding protein [Pseudomonas typographi]
MLRRYLRLAVTLLTLTGPLAPLAQAAEVNVMTSGGFTAAYQVLGPKWAQATGNTLHTELGPSMGQAPQAIPNRLARGEPADVVIMVGYALDELIKQGKVRADSRVELADSRIGVAVKDGAPVPDISTEAAFKATLLNARSIGYSDSASGVYIEQQMFKRLGIEAQVKGRAQMIPRIPVASQVAEGKVELGLQQVSELLPVKGAHFVGKIPELLQSVTRFAAGVPTGARHTEEAKALLRYLAAPESQPTVQRTGLDSVSSE